MFSAKILYDVPNWAYFRVADRLRKYAPPDFDVSTAMWPDTTCDALAAALGDEELDFLIINQFRQTPMAREMLDAKGWATKLVSFWNVGWPRRVQYFASTLVSADAVIFVNEEYWTNIGRPPNTTCIPRGVDLDVFQVKTPVDQRPRRVLWLGSEVNRTLKGYDEIVLPLEERVKGAGFECDFRLVESNDGGMLDADEMAAWFNAGRIFLCTSTTEGTPNVALEAAACGCTLVSTPVGNMPELIRHGKNGALAERTVDAFVAAIDEVDDDCVALSAAMARDIRAWGWDRRARQVFDVLRDLQPRKTPPVRRSPAARALTTDLGASHVAGNGGNPDLSDHVTVFVATVGAETFEACRHLLELQDCRFRLKIIRDVAPISAAFQNMLDDCETEFYVQVDEDMLLYPHAVRTLYDAIRAQPKHVAIHVERLFDTHVRRYIYGVKVFRHEIVKDYPFRDIEGCDVDQNARLQADGFELSLAGPNLGNQPFADTLGLHGTNWTKETAFNRYLKLSRDERQSQRNMGWRELPTEMAERFIEDSSATNFFALFGSIAGTIAPIGGERKEKDFRDDKATAGFRELEDFYARVIDPCGRNRP